MRKAKYIIKSTTQFKKDYKLALKRGLKIKLLEDAIAALAMGDPLPEKCKDHSLPLSHNISFLYKNALSASDREKIR